MTKLKVWVIEAVSLSAFALGCSGNGDTSETSADTQTAEFLFMDPHTSGPRLDVLALGDGGVSVSVGGPIGTQTDDLLFASADSLSELYQVLHPEVTDVPEELLDLERRLAPELELLAAQRAAATGEPLPAVTIEKSKSSFLSTVCKRFSGGSTLEYVPVECPYSTSTTGLWVGTPSSITAGDRTYGWNDVGGSAMLCWFTPSGGTTNWCITLPSYWWNWHTLYSGGPYYGSLVSNTYPQISGPRGLTHHDARTIVR
jgi:hypothetical protein